jgi:hypothetical protein
VSTRERAKLGGMAVVPQLQEIREFTAAGFALVRTLDWPYMEQGYGLLWVDAPKATLDLDANASHPGDDDRHRPVSAATFHSLTLLVLAGVSCGALSSLVSCLVLLIVLRRRRDAEAGRPLRASPEWD